MIYLQETPNITFLKITNDEGIKLLGFTKQEIVEPLANMRNEITQQPEDHEFVKWLKSESGCTDGFNDWEEARDWLEEYQQARPKENLTKKIL